MLVYQRVFPLNRIKSPLNPIKSPLNPIKSLSHLSHSILTGCSQPARSRAFVAALPRPELVPVMTTILRKTENPRWGLMGTGGQRPENTINCGFMSILEETKLKIFKHFCCKHLIFFGMKQHLNSK